MKKTLKVLFVEKNTVASRKDIAASDMVIGVGGD